MPRFTKLTVTILDVTFYVGNILAALLNFVIIALVLFLIIRAMEKMYRRMSKAETQTVYQCPECCM